MERKKLIKKNHIKEFGGRMPRRRPRDKLGTSQGHLGHLGLIFMCKSILKGQNVPGTDGTYRSVDRWDVSPGQPGRTPAGVPSKFFMFIGFSFFPLPKTGDFDENGENDELRTT